MNEFLHKVKLYTHIDLDGCGCELMLKHLQSKFFFDLDIERVNYGFDESVDWNKILNDYNCIFITDMSVNNETLQLFDEYEGEHKVVILDHHESFYQRLKEYMNSHDIIVDHSDEFCIALNPASNKSEFICNKSLSGTEVTYRYLDYAIQGFGNELLKKVAEAVGDYDLWKFETKFALPLQFLFTANKADYLVNKFLTDIKNGLTDIEFSIEDRTTIEKSFQTLSNSVDLLIGNIRTKESYKDSDGFRFVVSYCKPKLFSLATREFFKMNPNVDYLVSVDMNNDNLSIRAQNDKVDVSKIAEYFGGGGHKAAAGAHVIKIMFMDVPRSIQHRQLVSIFKYDPKNRNGKLS